MFDQYCNICMPAPTLPSHILLLLAWRQDYKMTQNWLCNRVQGQVSWSTLSSYHPGLPPTITPNQTSTVLDTCQKTFDLVKSVSRVHADTNVSDRHEIKNVFLFKVHASLSLKIAAARVRTPVINGDQHIPGSCRDMDDIDHRRCLQYWTLCSNKGMPL